MAVSACGSAERAKTQVADQLSQIQVVVDPRIELLSAVQQFNEPYVQMGLITKQNFRYKTAMHEWFKSFADHRAVQLLNEMANEAFNCDAPPTAMLHLSPPPELREVIPFTDYDLKRAGGRAKLDEFVAALFAPIADKMAAQAYGDWKTCVNEHIVRAVTTRFAYRLDGPAKGNEVMRAEEARGFIYIAPLVQALERFEKESTTYPTFADFYPQLIKVLENRISPSK